MIEFDERQERGPRIKVIGVGGGGGLSQVGGSGIVIIRHKTFR